MIGFALIPFFGPPEGRVSRLVHDGGLAAPSGLSNEIGTLCPIAPMRADLVVVSAPILHLFGSIGKRQESMGVQALCPEAAVELKLIKRQMYGRAKIDLLQARLIGAT